MLLALLFLILLGGVMSQEEKCHTNPDVLLEDPLRIGAWNVQRLGKTKIGKQKVVDIMAAVIQRYDIIVLQEVVDSSGKAQKILLEFLNDLVYINEEKIDEGDALRDPALDTYSMVQSKRLGSTRYKEQYVIYYRHEKVLLNSTYQYPDRNDIFSLEPFVVVFDTPTVDTKQIAIIPIHTSPGKAEVEIDALVDVYDDFVEYSGIEDAIILGDFNAGCSYVTGKEWQHIRLFNQARFVWLVSEHADTTTKSTSCPYDRIVIVGPTIKETVYQKSAKPFYFDEYFSIADEELVLDVSDHYPVEVLLKGRSQSNLEHTLRPKVSIGVEVEVPQSSLLSFIDRCLKASKTAATKLILEGCQERISEVSTKEVAEDHTPWKDIKIKRADYSLLYIEFETPTLESTIDLLNFFTASHPCIFTHEALKVLTYKLEHSVLQDPSIYNEEPEYSEFYTIVLCFPSDSHCKISIESRTNII